MKPNAREPVDSQATWRRRVHEVIFEAETPAGKAFDVGLLIAILLSVTLVMLETVEEIDQRWHVWLEMGEWFFTILFTIEYGLRLLAVRRPSHYARSFYGVVDLLAILPTYLSVLLPGAQSLMVIRILRFLRIFRVFKLAHLLSEAASMRQALMESRAKIAVFLSVVVVAVAMMGAAMYLVEGAESGFTSMPMGMYWAVVTMTTVGYGDIAPVTPFGKLLAAVIMILGYSLIIVPTGIISAEMVQRAVRPVSTESCPSCSVEGHDVGAVHCKWCGAKL